MTRRHAKIAGRCLICAALLFVTWWAISPYFGAPKALWLVTAAGAAYLVAGHAIAGWLIGHGDRLPPCLELVSTRPQQATAGDRLVNVASLCSACRIQTGATSPLRACPQLEAQRRKAALS